MRRETIRIEKGESGWQPLGQLPADVQRIELYREQEVAIFRTGSVWHTVAAHSHGSQWRGVKSVLLLKQRTRALARLVARIALGDDESVEAWLGQTVGAFGPPQLRSRWEALARQHVSLMRERYETR